MRYIKSLDTLRAIAVLFVLMLHGSYGFFIGGWIGVDLFFVISGFLITSILLKELNQSGISLSRFYIRRALRLFPPLIIGVVLANILWSYTAFFPGANRTAAAFGALFYFANILKGDVLGNMAHFWSLSVEEHFYFMWPVLLPVVIRNKKWLLVLVLFVSIFKIFVYNMGARLSSGVFIIDSIRFTFCKIDGILIGAILAFYMPVIKSKYATALLLGLLTIFLSILLLADESRAIIQDGGFILINLLCALALIMAVNFNDSVLFSSKILQWIGKRSYGIYVYHFPIFLFLARYKHEHDISNFVWVFLLRVAVTLLFAELSYRFIELPILSYKAELKMAAIKKAA